MKKFLQIVLTTFLLCQFLHAETAAQMTVDCTDEKTMRESIVNIMTKLDESTQQKFASAIATIGIVGMQKEEEGERFDIREAIRGKNVDEIIAIARRMAPNIRSNKMIVDGTTPDSLSKSLGYILVALDAAKQVKFSEAVAKIMYEAQQKKEPIEKLAKRLDGKNADEIIAIGANRTAPLPAGVEEFKEYSLTPVTKESAEKYLEAQAKKKPEDEQSLGESLAPSSIVEKK